ncbi:MAG: D-alanyl-D-alanine carboxypeptidase [Puniceicoccales bacterium]|nr:D-alanyl-D-alanine carboxypeptidase [Puniceicoccales bacterium]
MFNKFLVPVCLCLAGVAALNAAPKKATTPPFTYIGAICMDAETGTVFAEENADTVGQPASVTKLMTLLLVLERVDSGRISLKDTLTVSRDTANEGMRRGSSSVWLKQGEKFSIDELLYALMIKSANDAAVALAEHVAGNRAAFVQLMNTRAAELGMRSTRYTTPNGLPYSGVAPDVSSSRDLAILCRELLKHGDTLRYTSTKERVFRPDGIEGKGKTNLINHNKLLWNFPDDACDGLKTGYTDAAGCSIAATASRGGKRVIAIVLGGKGGVSARQAQRFREAKAGEMMTNAFAKLGVSNASATSYGKAPSPAVATPTTTGVVPATATPVAPATPATSTPVPAKATPVQPETAPESSSGRQSIFKFR